MSDVPACTRGNVSHVAGAGRGESAVHSNSWHVQEIFGDIAPTTSRLCTRDEIRMTFDENIFFCGLKISRDDVVL